MATSPTTPTWDPASRMLRLHSNSAIRCIAPISRMRTQSSVSPSSEPASQALLRDAALRFSEAQTTWMPRETRPVPTAAPISPGCRRAMATIATSVRSSVYITDAPRGRWNPRDSTSGKLRVPWRLLCDRSDCCFVVCFWLCFVFGTPPRSRLERRCSRERGSSLETAARRLKARHFLVENNRFGRIREKGQLQLPPGAVRIDLTGKTVMPAIVNAHNHLGWAIIKTGEIERTHYSRENLIDHLRRSAYYGIGAVMNFGTDPNDEAIQLGAETIPDAALFRTRPRRRPCRTRDLERHTGNLWLTGLRPKRKPEKRSRSWLQKKSTSSRSGADDRNGTVKKLPPSLYRAIINEAHKHNRVRPRTPSIWRMPRTFARGRDGFTHGERIGTSTTNSSA